MTVDKLDSKMLHYTIALIMLSACGECVAALASAPCFRNRNLSQQGRCGWCN
jgi:hypothetical protein